MAKGRSSKVGYYSVVQMGRECGQMTMDPNVGKQKDIMEVQCAEQEKEKKD